jgi:Leucine-rich repeat (LRR) protein
LENIGRVSALTNLTTLSLCHTQLVDVGDISELRQLEFLMLHSNNLTDVGNLSNLARLRYVNLVGNKLVRLGNVSSWQNLTALFLGNSIWNFENFSLILPKLQYLNVKQISPTAAFSWIVQPDRPSGLFHT